MFISITKGGKFIASKSQIGDDDWEVEVEDENVDQIALYIEMKFDRPILIVSNPKKNGSRFKVKPRGIKVDWEKERYLIEFESNDHYGIYVPIVKVI